MAYSGESGNAMSLSFRVTLGDALRIAMDFEWAGYQLYSDLADRLDTQARPLFLVLAEECRSHVEQLEMVGGRAELNRQLSQACAVRLRAEALRRSVSLPALPGSPIEDDALNFAEIRERLAYDYYCCLGRLPMSAFLETLILRMRDQKQRQRDDIRVCCASLFLIF